jgi:DNA/RNA-binding domain of Phe-tRNA-synthetase-like protein
MTGGVKVDRMERSYWIAEDVFAMFPDYVRGVVLAEGLTNGDSPVDLIALLRDAEAQIRSRLNPDTVGEHPRMVSWREAYRAFGAKPSKFRPSMEAMARRVLKDQQLPSISRLVDIGNIVSLRHLLPAGGHATDVVNGDMALKRATGEEIFVPLDSDVPEHPLPGEIILVEGSTVLTRRWTWRQAQHTLLMPSTTALEFNVDGLPPVPVAEVEEACHKIMDLIARYCGGSSRYTVLSRTNPSMLLSLRVDSPVR